MNEGSITRWVGELRGGDAGAAEELWRRYFARLVSLARRRLGNAPRLAADEEDVALDAFASFCDGVQHGRFPRLADRDGLWALLVSITAHKSVDAVRHEAREKRGGGRVLRGQEMEHILGEDPSPEFAVQVADELERLLTELDGRGDSSLRDIAQLRMQGLEASEIAEALGVVPRTVQRKLRLIATLWEGEA